MLIGEVPDWSVETDGLSYHDGVDSRVKSALLDLLSVEYTAVALGGVLTEDDVAFMAYNREYAAETLGGEDAFYEYLRGMYVMSGEVYDYLVSMDYLYRNAFLAEYGEGADAVPDDAVAAVLDEMAIAWYMSKHILIDKLG